ncbi:hypothetical protein [Catenulispora rubra]|uniref:hypothetical protein n=1 Tax=Catenulispora rubra TaxID=280293 RepID=UPI0018927245|nr:hypothetical protein [Catenulispora rubra]
MGESETVLRAQVAKAAETYRIARVGGDVEVWQQAANALADLVRIALGRGVDVGDVLGPATRDEVNGYEHGRADASGESGTVPSTRSSATDPW